jgi:hypothetical protein
LIPENCAIQTLDKLSDEAKIVDALIVRFFIRAMQLKCNCRAQSVLA